MQMFIQNTHFIIFKESLSTVIVSVRCVIKLTASRLCSVQSSSTGLSPGSAGGSIWSCGSSCLYQLKIFNPNWCPSDFNPSQQSLRCAVTPWSLWGWGGQRAGLTLNHFSLFRLLWSAAGKVAHAQSSLSAAASLTWRRNKRRSCGAREAGQKVGDWPTVWRQNYIVWLLLSEYSK